MNARIAVLPALLLLSAPAPALAQGEHEECRKRRVQEVEDLRRRLTEADDRMLDLARKYDLTKKKLQDEKEALLEEVARLKMENALLKAKIEQDKAGKTEKAAEKHPILDGRNVTLNFPDTPLSEVVSFIQDITGMNVMLKSSVPDGATVTLRAQNIPLRSALDLICEGSRTADGDELELMWRLKNDAIQIAKKKLKK